MKGRVGVEAGPLTIPPLWCPIPAAIHPDRREFDERASTWLARFGIPADESQQSNVARSGPGQIAARFAPRGTNEGVQLLADYLAWLFTFDNAIDEGTSASQPAELVVVFTRLLRAVEAPGPAGIGEGDPYALALRDVRLRFGEIASPVLVTRWVETLRASLFSWVREAVNRVRGVVPDLNDYAMTRIESCLVRNLAMLIAAVDGPEVPAAQLEQPAVRALIEMACTVMGWDNDIYSYRKEHVHRHEGHNNLLDVLVRAHGCSLAEAQTEARRMRDRVLSQFLRLRDQVDQTASPALRPYLANLSSMIRGQLDWSPTCSRFFAGRDDTAWPATFASAPVDDSSQPLLIPAIAWWAQTLP